MITPLLVLVLSAPALARAEPRDTARAVVHQAIHAVERDGAALSAPAGQLA